jgi:hypothetical protein
MGVGNCAILSRGRLIIFFYREGAKIAKVLFIDLNSYATLEMIDHPLNAMLHQNYFPIQ